jgi:hypothetical protein
VADTNYESPAPPPNLAPVLRGISGRATGNLALVRSGEQMPARCCSLVLNRDDDPLGTDEQTRRDMLLLLPVDATQSITDLHIEIVGEDGLEVIAAPPQQLEVRGYARDAGPVAPDGHRIVNGWVARVPTTLMPKKPWDIGGNRYPLNVTATYHVGPDPQPLKFTARGAIEAEVSSAIYEMGAASSVLPLVCLGAAFIRWRRTR